MIRSSFILAIIVGFTGVCCHAVQETSALPVKKYPQDTPEKALASVKKAIEADDIAYFIGALITPRDNSNITANYNGSTEEAAKAMLASKTICAENAKLADSIRELSSRAVTETGDDFGVKWKRLMIDDKNFFQLELQGDGRWCLNLRARSTAVKK